MGLSVACLAEAAETPRALPDKAAAIDVIDLAGTRVKPLADQGQKATVLIFVMHDCPVANAYAPEINRIISEYSQKGARCFVVYVESDLAPEEARSHAQAYGYKSGALLDPKHLLVKAAGVTVSPEAAVFSTSGQLWYRGRIDDRVTDLGKRRAEPTRRDLRQALDAILDGKPWAARLTKAIGCYIPDVRPSTPKRD